MSDPKPPAPRSPDSGPPGPPGSSGLPARRLSSAELEAVFQRATELQSTREDAAEGLTEGEVVRIGQEMGLEPHVVRRAIAEVRSRAPAEQGMLAGMMGPGIVRVARTIRRPAVEVGMLLERYLVQCEYMVVERRFPDRTRYVQASGIGAALGRAAARVSARQANLDLEKVDVGVAVADEDSCVVELTVDLTGQRAGYAAGGAALGAGTAAMPTVFALVTAAPDLLALLGIPMIAASMLGMRAGYRYSAGKMHDRLESFLDRLEHGELRLPPAKPDWRKQLGI
ncbi:MAG TPA: hypothetical protein VFR81_06765 [Longimicrobium sp.]|nr:hypothetical protein [Longimicrobium sp.]